MTITTTSINTIVNGIGPSLEARDLTVTVGRQEKTLLHGVSLKLGANRLLAVVGPSGAGKSTLLGALTGQRPASQGSVIFGGRDLYQDYDELRQHIGLVPQTDLLHTQLTVRRALEYGAELRFPRGTSPQVRAQRVAEVMESLHLTERADLRIDKLSGGQRKRVSVALELLTKPSLLFLDEPTSGLDPGLDLQVMQMMRDLADDGRTVVVVTHNVANLNLADDVLILAPGGYVAYYGPPAEAPGYFGAADFAEIFLMLEQTDGAEWDRRFRASPYADREDARSETVVEGIRDQSPSFTSQLSTMARRYLSVIFADKAYLTFLAILPVLLAVLGILVGSADGLGAGDPVAGNYQARFILLVLVLGAAFTGTASSVQELVKERTIYERERAVGVSRGAYLLSKLLVLGVITAVQATVFAGLSLAGRPGPANALVAGHGTTEVIVAVVCLAVVSMAVGLLLSALIPTQEVALPLLVLTTMVQVVLSGAVPIRIESVLDAIGWITPGYWAFSAMAATTDLSALTATDPQPWRWAHEAGVWGGNMAAVAAAFALCLLLTVWALRRREPRFKRLSRSGK